jgi:hypothetical protein
MSESNNYFTNLIKNIIIDIIIINIISDSITNNIYKICFYGVVSIYIIKKYI